MFTHPNSKDETNTLKAISIGVGLRHPHYEDVLAQPVAIDFVEVHSENFFAKGGASRALIKEVAQHYPISLHSTALGLGSQATIPGGYLSSLTNLAQDVNPILMSDHAAFSWGNINGNTVHAGDLLPVAFDETNLQFMANNIDRVQQLTGQRLLVENLSAYLIPTGSTMSETEFLVELTQRTHCSLLIDLNNLIVNGHNFSDMAPIEYAKDWLTHIPADAVGEIHLAGFTQVSKGELAIDDHSQAVSHTVWDLYGHALQRFGAQPTLIEWDNHLPSWQALVNEAIKARAIAQEVLAHD